jgi:hypothetical protein
MIPRKHQYDWASLTDAEKLRMFPAFKLIVQKMVKSYDESLAKYPEGFHGKRVGEWLGDVDHEFYVCECGRKRDELTEAQQAKLKEF